MLYGRFSVDVSAATTTPWVDHLVLLFPELVHDKLSREITRPIQRATLLGPLMQDIAERATRAAGGDVTQLAELDLLLTISHSCTASLESNYG